MEQIRVNVRATVNAKAIRREMHNGREHIVVPSFTLPSGIVMNGGMYPGDEIDKAFNTLEGTLAPLGHPQLDGEYVSARAPEAINAYHIGAWNRNVKKVGNRIAVEKWLDVEYAKNTEGGRQVLAAIDKGEPIHTSTGLFLEREMTPNADGYEWIARNMVADHDAILLNQPGAATPEQGVGMMVNKQLVINSEIPDMQTNESALEDSYGEKRALLSEAVKERFATADQYAYVEDFNDEAAIVCTPESTFKVRYAMEDGNPILGEVVGDVVQKVEYELKSRTMLGNLLERFKDVVQWNSKQTEPVQAPETEENDMTPEEVQAIVAEQLQAVNAKLDSVQAENATLKTELEAAKTSIAANAESALAEKRKVVAEKFGEVIANSLQGEALDEMFAKCQSAAPLVGGFQGNKLDAADDQWKDYSLNAQVEAK